MNIFDATVRAVQSERERTRGFRNGDEISRRTWPQELTVARERLSLGAVPLTGRR
jgi:hypothetical protein